MRKPSTRPSKKPSKQPKRAPSVQPSRKPSRKPMRKPSTRPSKKPSKQPRRAPSVQPSRKPSRKPMRKPSTRPSKKPSKQPRGAPSVQPSRKPSKKPMRKASTRPSKKPSKRPRKAPSRKPSKKPSRKPTRRISTMPSKRPSENPRKDPSRKPSKKPSRKPSKKPSRKPSKQLSKKPRRGFSRKPSEKPSKKPSKQPSKKTRNTPLINPNRKPSYKSIQKPSLGPSKKSSSRPSLNPSKIQSNQLSGEPSMHPSSKLSKKPSEKNPSTKPNIKQVVEASRRPSKRPSKTQMQRLPSMEPSKFQQNLLLPTCKLGFTGRRCDQCCGLNTGQTMTDAGMVTTKPECLSIDGDMLNFYYNFNTCERCPSGASVWLKYVGFGMLLLFFTMTARCLYRNPQLLGLFDLVINYIQCLSLLRMVNVPWPNRMQRIIDTGSFVNFDGITAGLGCYSNISNQGKIVLLWTLPLLSSLVMITLETCWQCARRKKHVQHCNKISGAIMLHAYYFYLQWNATSVQHVLCEFRKAPFAENFVSSNYCMEYDSAASNGEIGIGWLTALFFIAFVIPTFAVALIFVRMKRQIKFAVVDNFTKAEPWDIHHVDETCQHYLWLASPYRQQMWYWPFLVFVKKLVLVLCLAVLNGKVLAQILASLMVVVFTSLGEIMIFPFHYQTQDSIRRIFSNNNILNIWLNLSYALILGCALGLEKNNTSERMGRLAISSAILGVAAIVLMLCWNVCDMFAQSLRSVRVVPAISEENRTSIREVNLIVHDCDNSGEHDKQQGYESLRILTSDSKFLKAIRRRTNQLSMISSSIFLVSPKQNQSFIDASLPTVDVSSQNDNRRAIREAPSLTAAPGRTDTGKTYHHEYAVVARKPKENRIGLGLRLYYPEGTQPVGKKRKKLS